jgi:hypothetical protein
MIANIELTNDVSIAYNNDRHYAAFLCVNTRNLCLSIKGLPFHALYDISKIRKIAFHLIHPLGKVPNLERE